MKLAAIDVGSNAIRLLLSQVYETKNGPVFKKISLVRMPVRLGEDAFSDKKISEQKKNSLVNAFIGFKYLMQSYQPLDYMACATSAMREAANGEEVVKAVRETSGINLQIIDGEKEANMIFMNHIAETLARDRAHLYIDVGGGSTELTLFCEGKVLQSRSFNIGTVRLLENKVPNETWKTMREWLKEITKPFNQIDGIGSGGNINKIFRMLEVSDKKPAHFRKINRLYKFLSSYTLEERITKLGLRPDRADVIIPASQIFINVMKWAGIKEIFVPQVGLADGIIHILYEKNKTTSAG